MRSRDSKSIRLRNRLQAETSKADSETVRRATGKIVHANIFIHVRRLERVKTIDVIAEQTKIVTLRRHERE